MIKKLLLLFIPLILISSTAFATDITEENIITKTIVINKSEQDTFNELLEKSIVVDGKKYSLDSIKNQELETIDTKVVEQTKTIELSTNNKTKILSKFSKNINYNEDEYSGKLSRSNDTLKVATIKHGQYEKVFTINKEYSNLDKADLDYIPKEIVEDGFTYILTKCDWSIVENENVANVTIPKTYAAATTYKTIKKLDNPYTYKCTITYSGEVSKKVYDKIQYDLTYKQVEEDILASVLPIVGGTGVFILIFFLFPNAKITNYYQGKYKTIRYIRVSSRKPKVNLKHIPTAKTNVFSIKFNDKITSKLEGKLVTIVTKKYTYKKLIINKTIDIHI